MTATDELRRMLDERGVEWEDFDGEPTWTDDDGRMYYARGEFTFSGPTDEVTVYHLTPEQAVEATLGRGTCHDIGGCRWFRCSACGFGIEDMYVNDEDEYPPEDQPKHCPNCGRLVVEVDE